MEGTELFKETIKAYLDRRAAEDSQFAASYAKEGKSLDGCIAYILNTVQASGRNGFADEEIYGMAVHYYDEDDIKEQKAPGCKVVVNHTVELTEEEKEEARKQALKEYRQQVLKELKDKSAPAPAPAKKKKTPFEPENTPSLFDML